MHVNLYAEPRNVKIVYFVTVYRCTHTVTLFVLPLSVLLSIVTAGHLFFMVFGQLCWLIAIKLYPPEYVHFVSSHYD